MNTPIRLVAIFALGALAFGCSNRSSTQEATADCQKIAKVDPTVSGDAFKACVACFENCTDCQQKGTSPPTFQCPDDSAGGAGGGGTTSSTGSTGTGK